jgi:putative tricarboxylic transport membrane protein
LSEGDISPFFTRPISGVVAALIFGTIAWKVWDLRTKKVSKGA